MLAATRDFTLEVNASRHTVTADPDTPLLYILRNDLCLNGPKFGCGLGECGACAVLIDGVAARACTIPVRGAAGHAITTLEGLGTPQAPGPVQQAFIDEQAAQCRHPYRNHGGGAPRGAPVGRATGMSRAGPP
ncbi:(2Fe-2S)-binding protein, partial [Bordetella pertussis]|uniref:(2Fe-2S)-binding protein n=1 Tax=Bordetella pertussis TaxID=520 RepID=UPI00387A4B89